MGRPKPIASLSLDLDNQWAYLRAAGKSDWCHCASYLPLVTERITELLGEFDLPVTVFLVGRDLVEQEDVDAIASFHCLSRWEPANHSLNHLPWMHTMESAEIADEIKITEERILQTVGVRPFGFRGPGFSCPDEVLQILVDRGYLYDASIFPTSVAPLARMFFLMKTNLKGEQREKAKKLYGGFRSMLNPNAPYERQLDEQSLWEIPVSVMPFSRLPIHLSYLVYLASFSVRTAKAYFTTAMWLAKKTETPPSLLLHPPDFLGAEDDQDLQYLPGMNMPRESKLKFVRWVLNKYSQEFDVRCMIDQLRLLDPSVDSATDQLPVPSASHRQFTPTHSSIDQRQPFKAT